MAFPPPVTDNFYLRTVSKYEKFSYVTGNRIKENYWVYIIKAKRQSGTWSAVHISSRWEMSSGQEVREEARVVTTVMQVPGQVPGQPWPLLSPSRRALCGCTLYLALLENKTNKPNRRWVVSVYRLGNLTGHHKTYCAPWKSCSLHAHTFCFPKLCPTFLNICVLPKSDFWTILL